MSNRYKTLEYTFDMLPISDQDNEQVVEPTEDDIKAALARADEIDKQLVTAKRDEHDEEMDELAALAVQAHKDLQDLGMNVEIRHAGEIFSSASQMLKIAVDAKNNKVDKKLKMIKLQLDKLKMDRAVKCPNDGAVDAKATMLDRNELLKQLGEIERDTK
jgi:hypothetical protein